MKSPILALFQPAEACVCGHPLVPTCSPAVRVCPDCQGPCPACGFVHTAELMSLTCGSKSAAITSKDPIAAAILEDEDKISTEEELDELLAVVDELAPDPNPPASPDVPEDDPRRDAYFDALFGDAFGDITLPGA